MWTDNVLANTNKNVSQSLNNKLFLYLFQLTQPPVNSKVLAILSEVAGDALTKHLGKILQALMSSLKDSICTEREAQVRDWSL